MDSKDKNSTWHLLIHQIVMFFFQKIKKELNVVAYNNKKKHSKTNRDIIMKLMRNY